MRKVILWIYEEDERDDFEDEEERVSPEESLKNFKNFLFQERSPSDMVSGIIDINPLLETRSISVNYSAFYHQNPYLVSEIFKFESKVQENEMKLETLTDKKEIKKLKREIKKQKDFLNELILSLQKAYKKEEWEEIIEDITDQFASVEVQNFFKLVDYYFYEWTNRWYYNEELIDARVLESEGDNELKSRYFQFMNLSQEQKDILQKIELLDAKIAEIEATTDIICDTIEEDERFEQVWDEEYEYFMLSQDEKINTLTQERQAIIKEFIQSYFLK